MMASLLGTCGRVGLVTVSLGYVTARMTAAIAYTTSRKTDLPAFGASGSDQAGPNSNESCEKNRHEAPAEWGMGTALQTALR
ncbi:hypothetical protein R1flu_026593 [Riccia fluitans]|uniref:Uncharacterized protein n=1 Tax=Riccia fluitans TaxID=41844 RepID=A0ABD1XGW7_9MARC